MTQTLHPSSPPASLPLALSVGVTTDVGMKRQKNEDSVFADPHLGLFIVADGMGGHQGGATASRIAIETISQSVEQDILNSSTPPVESLSKAIHSANSKIYKESEFNPALKGMGTTTIAALVHSNRLILGHVGDSRCYYIRSGSIWQLTPDHSFLQEQLRAGLISREKAESSSGKNVITRCVGFYPTTQVDIFQMSIHPDDLFLLCSDGLTGMIEDREILRIVERAQSENQSLQEATQRLIQAANEKGGTDNISCILIQAAHSHPIASTL